jgi:Ca2+-binding RTX toxin-like protein
MADLTAHEQYLLELVNRARLDPQGEADRYGISLGGISAESKQPLAASAQLTAAARAHSQWMIDTDTFSHTGAGGSSAGDRMASAGYSFTGSWAWGENISWWGTTGSLNLTPTVALQHESLFESSGHRANLLSDSFREMGVGLRTGNFLGYNASMLTEGFARSGTSSFLTGVAYSDTNGDHFYTPGEGRGGVQVSLQPQSGALASATTAGAGGYEVALAAATYSATFAGGGLPAPLGVFFAMGGRNVKVDLVGTDGVAASVSVTLGANARALTLYGTEPLSASGNALANVLVGNLGDNAIDGAAGSDTLRGGAGDDTFLIRAGEADGDALLDFAGNGPGAGDEIVFDGFRADVSLEHLGGNSWRLVDGDRVEDLTIAGPLDATDYRFVNSLAVPPPPPQTATEGPDLLEGTDSDDRIEALGGNDTVRGRGGQDTLAGGDGSDRLAGDRGADRLQGGEHNDQLAGGWGDDGLEGGPGNDRLTGGPGNDTLEGGTGKDRFVFAGDDGIDTISDFSRASGDRLVLSTLFDELGYAGGDPIGDGYLRAIQAGASVEVQVDPDGGGDGFLTLVTLQDLTIASLGAGYFLA